MTHHPRCQKKLEDLFLTVFVYIDDWLKPYHNILPSNQHSKQATARSSLSLYFAPRDRS